MYILMSTYPYMTKIVLNCKLKEKQAPDKQDCDKVPLMVVCIDR